MRRLREATNRGFDAVPHAIRLQPDYNTEVSDAYLTALTEQIRSKLPENFSLTPISEPGW